MAPADRTRSKYCEALNQRSNTTSKPWIMQNGTIAHGRKAWKRCDAE